MKSIFPQNFSPFQCVVRVSPGHHTVHRYTIDSVMRIVESPSGDASTALIL